jgi:hypothetical protein
MRRYPSPWAAVESIAPKIGCVASTLLDWVKQFKAQRPNHLWVSDFNYVLTWQGWLYVAFVIDVYARRVVGWRVSTSMHTDFVLDALEQSCACWWCHKRCRKRPSRQPRKQRPPSVRRTARTTARCG